MIGLYALSCVTLRELSFLLVSSSKTMIKFNTLSSWGRIRDELAVRWERRLQVSLQLIFISKRRTALWWGCVYIQWNTRRTAHKNGQDKHFLFTLQFFIKLFTQMSDNCAAPAVRRTIFRVCFGLLLSERDISSTSSLIK